MKSKILNLRRLAGKTRKYQVDVMFDGRFKRIRFGQKPYRDFTLINRKTSKHYVADPAERELIRKRYLQRHRNEDWETPNSSAFFSRWLLWELPTVEASLQALVKRGKVEMG